MGKKYKPKFNRDYDFYLNNKDKFNLAGCVVPEVPFSKEGVDAKRALVL